MGSAMADHDTVCEIAEPVQLGNTEPNVAAKKEEDNEKFDNLADKKVDVHEIDVETEVSKEENESMEEETMEEEVEVHAEGESGDKVDENDTEKWLEVKEIKGNKRGNTNGDAEKENRKRSTVMDKNKEQNIPRTFTGDRPVRERKSVERLVVCIEKEAVKEFHIEKGHGTELKNIPNVAHKLSRRNTDDTLKSLHTVLFGRRAKAAQVKKNILLFSGFVWHEDEDMQKIKLKEKLDKCVKEKLFDFCNVLDIRIGKKYTKEDIVMKLIEFLVAPHATTTTLLAQKHQTRKGEKRKRVENGSISGNTPSDCSGKNRKKIKNASTAEKKNSRPKTKDESEANVEEANVNSVPIISEHPGAKRSSSTKELKGKAEIKKVTTPKTSSKEYRRRTMKSLSNCSDVNSRNTSSKLFSRKKKSEVVVKDKSSTPKKSASMEKTGKNRPKEDTLTPSEMIKVVKEKKNKPKEEKSRPTDDELRTAITEILKEVDFNMATFKDVRKLLGKRFKADLTPRKSSIKLMIHNELAKLVEEDAAL